MWFRVAHARMLWAKSQTTASALETDQQFCSKYSQIFRLDRVMEVDSEKVVTAWQKEYNERRAESRSAEYQGP